MKTMEEAAKRLADTLTVSEPKGLVYNAFKEGAKWALENQWHDLVKNPDDMPDSKLYDWVLVSFKDSRDGFIGVPTIAEFKNGVWNTTESYEGTWSSVKDVLGDAIAWMPIPSLPKELK